VDLVAQEGGEDTSLATGLYSCKGRGHAVIEGRWILVAAISGLGSPSRCHDHPSGEAGEEAAEGVPEETAGISNAAPTPGSAG
jgi:hypothetical protein